MSYLLFFQIFLNFDLNLRSLWRAVPNGYFSLTSFIRESSRQRTGKEHILGEICRFLTILQELQELQLFGAAWKGPLFEGRVNFRPLI